MASLMRRQTLRMLKKKGPPPIPPRKKGPSLKNRKEGLPPFLPEEQKRQKGEATGMLFKVFQERRRAKNPPLPYRGPRVKGAEKTDSSLREMWKKMEMDEARDYVRKLKRKKKD